MDLQKKVWQYRSPSYDAKPSEFRFLLKRSSVILFHYISENNELLFSSRELATYSCSRHTYVRTYVRTLVRAGSFNLRLTSCVRTCIETLQFLFHFFLKLARHGEEKTFLQAEENKLGKNPELRICISLHARGITWRSTRNSNPVMTSSANSQSVFFRCSFLLPCSSPFDLIMERLRKRENKLFFVGYIVPYELYSIDKTCIFGG